MQSFLQYRRFERRLREQIERHGVEKAAGAQPGRMDTRDSHDSALCTTERRLSAQSPASQPESRDYELEEKEIESHGPTSRYQAAREKLSPPSSPSPPEGRDYALEGEETKNENSTSRNSTIFHNLATTTDDNEQINLSGSTTRKSSSDSSDSSDSSARRRPPQQNILSTATTRETDDGARLGQALTGVNVRTRKTNEGGREKGRVFIVGFAGNNDLLNPHNWTILKRISTTMLVASIGLIVGLASSIDSAALEQARKEFGVSKVVESLATGLYLVGFGFGAFFAAPISETVGRNPVYIATMLLFMIFTMASGLAPNIGAQLVFRFLAGFFGSTPLTCAGGSISDMWTAAERTAVFPIFANSAFWGPILGPVIGGFIGQASAQGTISWRWTEWVTLIWSGLILSTMVLFMPETYAPTLMKWKASHLRRITGDDRYVSPLEVQDTKFKDRLVHNLYRPFVLFAFEPIVVLFTLYLTVVYIVLFTFLTGFSFIFTDIFHLSQGLTFLCFLGIGVGFFGASILVPWVYKRYKRHEAEAQAQGQLRLPPEERLIFAMLGAPALPIGLFWMGWTAYPSISVWSCIAATIPIGFAIMGIFISTYQYLIDGYEAHAASALVGCTFVRYVISGGFVEVSLPMYENLGVHWTLTVLGAISAVMAPVPFIFFKYGSKIRKHSRHATDFGAGR